MKDKKDKERKNHESTIGKIIYGFLLFLPLFAIGVTCLVNTFNNQAKVEPLIEKYETNEVNTIDDLIEGNAYNIEFLSTITGTNSNFYIGNVSSIQFFYIDNLPYANIDDNFGVYIRTTLTSGLNAFMYFLNPLNNTQVSSLGYIASYANNIVKIPFIYKGGNIDITYIRPTNIDLLPLKNVESNNISNTFYYSIDKVQQSPLFNWAENSIIYTGMHNFTSALDITNTFIPLLLTYWLIISVVYFLYDIVLVILVVLHRKIHKMQDSI